MDSESALLCCLLLAAAAGMMVSHVRTWRRARAEELEAEEYDFRRRQFRRRVQTSAMLAVVGVAVLLGSLIEERPLFFLLYWAGVLLMVCWVILLALADIWAIKYHYGRRRQACVIEQARLQAKLKQLQDVRGNGKKRK